MSEEAQSSLLSSVMDLEIMRLLLADVHDDLPGKVARSHRLADLSLALGSRGNDASRRPSRFRCMGGGQE